MKKSDLIESWLNSDISEDEAILILERMKHDDTFTKEMVDLGEIHACLYTIFHEETSFDELKLNQQSMTPDDMEEQIMKLIASGDRKEKEKKKRITVVDLPQNVTAHTRSFEQPKNYWPLIAGVAAILTIILGITALSSKAKPVEVSNSNLSNSSHEGISLVEEKKSNKPAVTLPVEPKGQPEKVPQVVVSNNVEKTPEPEKKIEKDKVPEETVKPEIVEKKTVPEEPVIPENENFIGYLIDSAEYNVLTRDGKQQEISDKTEVLAGDSFSTSYESNATLRLKDGSEVSISPSATLQLEKNRIIIQSGKAFFKVAKQKNGTFEVVSGETTTRVVGTEFSVSYQGKLSLVKVIGGIVKVTSKDKEVTLTKGQGSISRDGESPEKYDLSEQYGIMAAAWSKDQVGSQVDAIEYDITKFLTSAGYQDFYFKKHENDSKGMLQVFRMELYENDELIGVDEHNGVTSNHTTELRNRNVWLHGGYGSSMYRFYLKNFSADKKYTIKVRCRSFKGSCDGEIWLLTTVPDSPTLRPGVIPTGNNLAYRKKVTSEKEGVTQNHEPEKVVDNKITPQSSWWGAGSSWIQIDLGKITEFDSIFTANFWEQNCYHQYIIEVSRDGEKWEKVIDMSKNTLPAHESGEYHSFDTVEARYVRMTVSAVKFSQGGISVVEIKVFKNK